MIDYPDEDRVQWLISRPWYKPIHATMNSILQQYDPKTHIVAVPHEHIDLDNIISNGKLFSGKVYKCVMETSQCHDNCELLLKLKLIDSICTGYALSDDGLWRFHSWGLTNAGTIVETTAPRIKYFGIII